MNTGIVIAFKTWQGDPFGDIGYHCMYLRGWNSKLNCLIGCNNLGPHQPEFDIDLEPQRRIQLLAINVVLVELLTGSDSDKDDYYFCT